jgi:hypothetical protein
MAVVAGRQWRLSTVHCPPTNKGIAMNRLWIVLAATGLVSVGARAASPDPKDLVVPPAEMSKAQGLVRLLGSEVYKEREQAHEQLSKMGRLGRPALIDALTTDPSPEVRARAIRLLPKAEAADLQARIETFLADTEAKFQHDLPGWALFRKELDIKDSGTEKALREIYVDAIKAPANLEVLTALSTTPEAAGRAIAERRMNLFLQQNPGAYGRLAPGMSMTPKQPTLADVAVLMLSETQVDSKHIPKNNNFGYITAAQFVQSQASMNALNNPDATPQAAAYKKLFVKWLDSRTSPDDLNSIYWLANNFRNIKETGALLRRVVSTDGVQPYAKAQCMIYLLQRGGPDELATLRTQLKNDASINNGGKVMIAPNVFIEAQLRDIALALLLHHEKQDMKKFGFEFQPGFNPAQVATNYWGYGFKNDDDRKAAHKKFEEYEAEKKKTNGGKVDPKKDETKKDEPKKDAPAPPQPK